MRFEKKNHDSRIFGEFLFKELFDCSFIKKDLIITK